MFELATPFSVRVGRRSMSPSIDFYNNFSHPSSAGSPQSLLKIRQNSSVQALFGETAIRPARGVCLMPGVHLILGGALPVGSRVLSISQPISGDFLQLAAMKQPRLARAVRL